MDFPPVAAWVAWFVSHVAGNSLIALRLVSLACGVGTVFLVALTARELGGRLPAQLGASLAWAASPYILGSASIFHPTWFDTLAWAAYLYVMVRILVRPEPRLWPLLGVVAGIGMEAKYTIAFLIAVSAVALLAFDRGTFRTRGPWIAAGIALLLLAPNLAWQAAHGWPSIHFASSQNAKTAADTSRPVYVAEQILFLGATFAVAVIGVVSLWRRRLRALATIPVLVTIVFFFERGRGYYPLPADGLAVAAGAVAIESWTRRGRRRVLIATLVVLQLAAIALVAPVIVPIYPTRTMISRGIWKNSFFKDEIGWPELTNQVVAAWNGLPAADRADGAVVASNYGEAAALAHFGHGRLPLVLSGHLSWQYWHPALDQRHLVTVGYYPDELRPICSSWRIVAFIHNGWRLANEELGRPIATCTLKQPLSAYWHQPDFARDVL